MDLMDQELLKDFFAEHWGDIASTAGFILSIWILFIAIKAREAAEAAKSGGRRRNLSEELQDAQRKSEQIGLFLIQRQWNIVFLRAQDVTSICSQILERWQEELLDTSKDNLLLAQRLAASISKSVLSASHTPLNVQEFKRVSSAQQRVYQILSGEVGQIVGSIERS